MGLPSAYEVEQLARVFYPGARPRQTASSRGMLVFAAVSSHRTVAALRDERGTVVLTAPPPAPGEAPKTVLCRLVYKLLCARTGLRPPWGMLTGVRPLRLYRKRTTALGRQAAEALLAKQYDLPAEKLALLRRIDGKQRPLLESAGPLDCCLYISIPFCPSRCDYCSFVSRTIERERHLVAPYLDALELELAALAAEMAHNNLRLRAFYIGGGTPTALNATELERLLTMAARLLPLSEDVEYTVEAGRPDCTDAEKLALLKSHEAQRISINPQSMSREVLAAIGRRHGPEDILRCFEQARAAGHQNINMDLIAGLPADDEAGFGATLEQILTLAPENITLHTLTLKRASNLVVDSRSVDTAPVRMLAAAKPRLEGAGYAPYYLYRQKGTVQNLENTGWCLPGAECLYNVLIMEEETTILAAGAGATAKLVAGRGEVIKRKYNPKFPLEYIKEIDSILEQTREVREFYGRYLDTKTPGGNWAGEHGGR